MANETTIPVDGKPASSAVGNENMNDENRTVESGSHGAGENTAFQKLLKEKRNAMTRIQELESVLKQKEENALLEKEEYKTLAERREKELIEEREKSQQLVDRITSAKKKTALKRELTKLGLEDKYFSESIYGGYLNSIQIDGETEVVTGADEAAKSIFEKFPPLFSGSSVKANHAAPSEGGLQTLTYETWKNLPREEKAKRSSELQKNLGLLK